jgi:YVTN family beta-propeller protein
VAADGRSRQAWLKGMMVMKHKAARTIAVAGVSAALCLAGLASAASASAASAHRPAWHIIYTQDQNAEFEAVVATGKTSGFALLEPNATVAVPSAYERTGATTFTKVPFPTVADEWVAGASASSRSDVYVFADILTLKSSKAESEVLKWTGKKFSVVAAFAGELGGGTVLSPDDVYAYGSGSYGGGSLPSAGVYHYNGHTWTKISSTLAGNGDALSATSAYVADGTDLYRYNGHKWTSTNLASLLPAKKAGNDPALSGVLARSPDDIYATGNAGQYTSPAVILHYNGHTWAKVASYPAAAVGQPVSDGKGGLWAPETGPGGSGLLHYSHGTLTAVAGPEYDHSHAIVDSISRIPGTPEELAGGVFPLSVYPSPAVILQYSAQAGAADAPTLYVTSANSASVTPVNTATNKAGKPIGVGSAPQQIAITPNGRTVYVADGGTDAVVPIDTATNKAGKPIGVGSAPQQIAITPNGRTVYVADGGTDAVVPIDTATNKAGTPIKVGAGPLAIAITPNGKTAYVITDHSAAGTSFVTPVNLATGKAGKPIKVGGAFAEFIAITPDGKMVYVLSDAPGTVTAIRTATNTVARVIKVGKAPTQAIAITPDGKTAYVGSAGSDTVTPISTVSNKAAKPIKVAGGPEAIAITPNGKTAYVVDTASDTVTPISTATDKAGKPIGVGSAPLQIAITPNGKTAYVTDPGRSGSSDIVTPISTATNKAGKPIAAGPGAEDILITPNGKTAYIACIASGTVVPITIATNKAQAAIRIGTGPDDMTFAITP